jgi:hypothetical protein
MNGTEVAHHLIPGRASRLKKAAVSSMTEAKLSKISSSTGARMD